MSILIQHCPIKSDDYTRNAHAYIHFKAMTKSILGDGDAQ